MGGGGGGGSPGPNQVSVYPLRFASLKVLLSVLPSNPRWRPRSLYEARQKGNLRRSRIIRDRARSLERYHDIELHKKFRFRGNNSLEN